MEAGIATASNQMPPLMKINRSGCFARLRKSNRKKKKKHMNRPIQGPSPLQLAGSAAVGILHAGSAIGKLLLAGSTNG
jgi:hypothetical protein